jgi:hypothetical protein
MARNWYGEKRIIKEDKYTRKSNQYSEWEITKEKLKIVLWLILGNGMGNMTNLALFIVVIILGIFVYEVLWENMRPK